MQNIIQQLHNKSLIVSAVITNNKSAEGIHKAESLGVKVEVLPHTEFGSREEFDTALVSKINEYAPDLTVLAGFMRILTPIFTDNIKAVNIHPSLLPLFKGKDGIKDSFFSGMRVGGVSVHMVNSEMDGGEIVAQECVPIFKNDTLESYTKRVHEKEYELYPKAILEVLGLPI